MIFLCGEVSHAPSKVAILDGPDASADTDIEA